MGAWLRFRNQQNHRSGQPSNPERLSSKGGQTTPPLDTSGVRTSGPSATVTHGHTKELILGRWVGLGEEDQRLKAPKASGRGGKLTYRGKAARGCALHARPPARLACALALAIKRPAASPYEFLLFAVATVADGPRVLTPLVVVVLLVTRYWTNVLDCVASGSCGSSDPRRRTR